MKIAIGCDHGGLELKDKTVEFLKSQEYQVEDMGTYTKDSCDYPEFGQAVAEAVACGKVDRGIVICTTGIGISISANKVKGVRCALCSNEDSAKFTRYHNDANCLAMGAKYTSEEEMKKIVTAFLTSQFEGGRHQRRVDKITAIEDKYFK